MSETVRILSSADGRKNYETWQDHWLKQDLMQAFKNNGCTVIDGRTRPNIDIVLHGRGGFHRLGGDRNFCWLIGHPEFIEKDVVNWADTKCEHTWVMSPTYLPKIQRMFPDHSFSLLMGGSSKEFVPRISEPEYDIAFIGKRIINRPNLVKALLAQNKYRIAIVGNWGSSESELRQLAKGQVGLDWYGPHLEPDKVTAFFNNSKLTFYSVDGPQKDGGFPALRPFDIFAGSEILCIHYYHPGWEQILPEMPMFKTIDEFLYLVDYYLTYPEEAKKIATKCRNVVRSKYMFDHVVKQMLHYIRG